ncbi:hypothetical protein CBL_09183 [Carabus blaptoides fortunei]
MALGGTRFAIHCREKENKNDVGIPVEITSRIGQRGRRDKAQNKPLSGTNYNSGKVLSWIVYGKKYEVLIHAFAKPGHLSDRRKQICANPQFYYRYDYVYHVTISSFKGYGIQQPAFQKAFTDSKSLNTNGTLDWFLSDGRTLEHRSEEIN